MDHWPLAVSLLTPRPRNDSRSLQFSALAISAGNPSPNGAELVDRGPTHRVSVAGAYRQRPTAVCSAAASVTQCTMQIIGTLDTRPSVAKTTGTCIRA